MTKLADDAGPTGRLRWETRMVGAPTHDAAHVHYEQEPRAFLQEWWEEPTHVLVSREDFDRYPNRPMYND